MDAGTRGLDNDTRVGVARHMWDFLRGARDMTDEEVVRSVRTFDGRRAQMNASRAAYRVHGRYDDAELCAFVRTLRTR